MAEDAQSRMTPRQLMKHRDAMEYVDKLVLDLKKQLLGYEMEPLTMDRLDEWTKTYRHDLERCTEPDRYY